MSNLSTQSPSPTKTSPENGELEDETPNDQSSYPQRKYKLEDFSQQRINRGQQEINYLITVVDEKVVEALKELRLVVSRLASPNQIDWRPLDNAIAEVSNATKKVAGPFPPSCVKPESEE